MSNIAFTLSANNFHTLFIPEKEVEVEDNPTTRVVIYADPISTLVARDAKDINTEGAAGGKLVIMEDNPIVFYGNRVDDIRVQGEVVNTLQARMGTGGGNMPLVAYPIQDGREMEKSQNGLGIGDETNPSFTLDRTGAQAVAFSVREDAKANTFSATEAPTSLALQGHQPSPQSHHAQLFIAQQSIVRRLTPTECERLQGFPDGWTADQADSHRYKQLGNAVAVPCVEFIIERLVKLHESNS